MSFLVAASLAALLQVQAPAAGAMLSGRVVEQGTQTPIAGARVQLLPAPQSPPTGPPAFRPMQALSDANGRFQFSDVVPGRYRITAQKTGFASVDQIGAQSPPFLDLTGGGQSEAMVLSLQRGGAIAGRIIDATGEPVADARVMPLRRMPPIPRGAPPAVVAAAARSPIRLMPAGAGAQTNDLGEFRLHSLPPGDYYVQATSRSSFGLRPAPRAQAVSTTTLPTFFPDTTDPQAAQSLQVFAGQTSEGIIIRLLTVPAFQVTGVVMDESGQPVANAMIRLLPPDQSAAPLPMMGPPTQAQTDVRGAFVLSDITSGSYTLLAMPPMVVNRDPTQAQSGGDAGGFVAVGGSYTTSPARGMVITQSINGASFRYREDAGTKVPIAVNDASVFGVQVVVQRPSTR